MKHRPAPTRPVSGGRPPGVRYVNLLAAILFAVAAVLIFHRLFDGRVYMEAGDSPPLKSHEIKGVLREGALSGWGPYHAPGSSFYNVLCDWQVLFFLAVPELKTIEAIMAFSVLTAALFFFLFLRERGYGVFPSLVGAMSLGFSTSFISMAYAGHLGKFAMISYGAAALWAMNRALRRGSWLAAGFAGLCVGYALANQVDVAILFLLAAGLFWLREAADVGGGSPDRWRLLVGRLVLAGIVGAAAVWPVVTAMFRATSSAAGPADDPQQHWEWATQWSLPPPESMRLVCASYYGLDSWNPAAPYWGWIGRSAGWAATKQGFRNFTQTNEYLGVVVVILALAAVIAFLPRWRRRTLTDKPNAPPADTLFWFGLALISLLLCFGKYLPFLFRLFSSLPTMASFRNPVKFIHIISFAVAILAAQGAFCVERVLTGEVRGKRACRFALPVASAALSLFFLVALLITPWNDPGLKTRLAADGFTAEMPLIARGMQTGLTSSLALSGLTLAVSLLIAFARWWDIRWNRLAACGMLVALASGDLIRADRWYVRYNPGTDMYAPNGVLEYLKEYPNYRVKFLPHTWGAFNYWNSLLTPYHGIRSADMPAMSRPPADLAAFYEALGDRPSRMWQLMGIRHIVTPRQLLGQVKEVLGPALGRVRGFDLVPAGATVLTRWSQNPAAGNFVVVENTAALATPTWYGSAKRLSDEEVLKSLHDPAFDVTATLLLQNGAASAGASPDKSPPSAEGTCRLVMFSRNRIRIQCEANAPGWVFVNDYFDPDWRAYVDGKRTPVIRADAIFRAVAVPTGSHAVELVYRPAPLPFWMPLGCLLILAAVGTAKGIRRAVSGRSS